MQDGITTTAPDQPPTKSTISTKYGRTNAAERDKTLRSELSAKIRRNATQTPR